MQELTNITRAGLRLRSVRERSALWVLVGEGEMLLVRQFIDSNSSIQSALEIGKSAVKMHTLQLSKIVKRLSQLEEETFKRNFIDTNLN